MDPTWKNEPPMLLAGIKVNISISETRHTPVQPTQLMRLDGKRWVASASC